MSNIKYSQDSVEKIFMEHGLILKDTYKNNKISLYCVDSNGYEYLQSLGNLLNDKGHCKIHKGNPYSINNINRYLKEIDSTLVLLEDKYLNSNTDMKFRCECGKEFSTTWNNIMQGKRYCNFCAKSKRFDNYRDYTKEIKEYCISMGYTLITPYIHRCFDTFEYICNKHKDKGIQHSYYDLMINSHSGCKFCGIESMGNLHRLDESMLKTATEKVGFIYIGYDYDNKDSKYKKVNIHYICPNHISKGIQTIKYNNLLRSNGKCQYCIGKNRTKEDLQIELDKLNDSVEILEYDDYSSPILAKCKICGHEWKTTGVNLTQGHRCPFCSKSNFEIEVSKVLNKWKYRFESEYVFDNCRDVLPLPFDFYLSDYNVLIEADGEHHYIPIKRGSMTKEEIIENFNKIKFHDEIKDKYCKENSIYLIRIPYWERDNLEYFLWDEFVKIGLIKEIAV